MTTPQGRLELADRIAVDANRHPLRDDEFPIYITAEERDALVAALRLSASPAGNGGRAALSDFTDAEIANEYYARAMRFLGDQRVGVGVPTRDDFLWQNPAPDASPARVPTGHYRIVPPSQPIAHSLATEIILASGGDTKRVDEAASVIEAALTPAVAPDGAREALERILTDAMSWHPSENGPSYTETKDALRKRLLALALPAVVGIEGREVLPSESAMRTALNYMSLEATRLERDARYVSGSGEGAEIYRDAAKCIAAALARHPHQPVEDKRAAVEVERRHWPDPTPEMLDGDPMFDAIWNAIKTWDINVPHAYGGYCGATGNHVRAIYDAVFAHPLEPATDSGEG